MDLHPEVQEAHASIGKTEHIQTSLDEKTLYLKTLYDLGHEVFSTTDPETILRNFLLMTMGNFGVMEGFILTMHTVTREIDHFVSLGFPNEAFRSLRDGARLILIQVSQQGPVKNTCLPLFPGLLTPLVTCTLSFRVEHDHIGLLGLGAKIVGEPYSEGDEELLSILFNNLAVSLSNARSFQRIQRLNENLHTSNIQLEQALNELRAAMRKVEILESMKANLSKFVPNTVCRLIEKSPTFDLPSSREQDVSVLFLDIEGYTRICEKLDPAHLNAIIEKFFSAVMDAIYANNGDVNETAGDGLMVLFLDEDPQINALEAVRTALLVREKVAAITKESGSLSEPVLINIGINSGPALVGAVKFESYTGSRWTYTARGSTTNVAARIGGLATGGGVFLSGGTAARVGDHYELRSMGKLKLKNVSEEVEVFSL